MRTTNAFAHFFIVGLLVLSSGAPTSAQFGLPNAIDKLDPLLQQRASQSGRSRVIISVTGAGSLALLSPLVQLAGGVVGRSLPIINGRRSRRAERGVVGARWTVRSSSHISMDRLAAGALERTGATVGATACARSSGYDGAGVGVAIIDSGVRRALDDLLDAGGGASRVDRFVDFVNGASDAVRRLRPRHARRRDRRRQRLRFERRAIGHRAGARASSRSRCWTDPGSGRISDVIAALDYAVAQKDALEHPRRSICRSRPAVYESYNLDPLTLAAKRAVDAGIVVVAAAGNNGREPAGPARTTAASQRRVTRRGC